jgi:quercetin dioxygenase-like cupin family protein
VHRPGESERRWLGEFFADFLASGDETGGAFALLDERGRRGQSVQLHRHDEDWESFYVVEGELTLFVGEERVLAGPGTFAHAPAGTVHGFRVESESARYLLLTTARHGEFYRAITGAEGDEIESVQIRQACVDYGVESVGPLPD